MPPLRLGIVGCGFGAYGIAAACRLSDRFVPTRIAARTLARAQAACAKYGIANATDDANALIDDPGIDVVALAVPPQAQAELALRALALKKPIFAEKPLAATLAQARALAQACGATPNMIDFQISELPSFLAARRLVASGALGAIRHVGVDWRTESHSVRNRIDDWKTDPAQGGGALAHMASHSLHYLECFAGPIRSLQALFASALPFPGRETAALLAMRFAGGAVGALDVSVASPGVAQHRVSIEGDRGALRLEGLLPNPVRFSLERTNGEGGWIPVLEDPPPIAPDMDARAGAVHALLVRLADWIATGRAEKPDFADGLRVQTLVAAARESNDSATRIIV